METEALAPARKVGEFTFGPVQDSKDLELYAKVAHESFDLPQDITTRWLAFFDRKWTRIMKDTNGVVVAGAVGVPMGIFLNGKAVKCMGVTAVSVAFHERGSGCGGKLMGEYVKDLANEENSAEFPISLLYPTANAFYRKLGYEVAGSLYETTLDMAELCMALHGMKKPRDVVIRPLNAEQEMDRVKELFVAHAQTIPGAFDRSLSPYLWRNVFSSMGQMNTGYVVQDIETGTIEGYAFVRQSRPDPSKFFELNLVVQDMVFTSERASLALLFFLASHRSVITKIDIMSCPISHPWAFVYPHFETKMNHEYMIRLLNVQEALRQRAYPSHVTAKLSLDVTDESFEHNNGTFLLHVEKGNVVQCDKAASNDVPVLSISVIKLAALYTGYLNVQQLVLCGMVQGTEEAISMAALIFGITPNGSPCATDFI